MKKKNFQKNTSDFSGWATHNDIECSDGVVIRHGAFQSQDGATVPMVWNHNHEGVGNVLGTCLLEAHNDGVRAYGFFNDTEAGQTAKELVKHGDIDALSIYANRLKKSGNNVFDGTIREVSLVLAGANPGAKITEVIAHSDEFEDLDSLEIISREDFVCHADKNTKADEENKDEETKKEETKKEETKKENNSNETEGNKSDKTVGDVAKTFTEEEQNAFERSVDLIFNTIGKEKLDEEESAELKEIVSVIEKMNDDKKKVFTLFLTDALESNMKDAKDNDTEEDTATDKGDDKMKHNVFANNEEALMHADYENFENKVMTAAKKSGSFKDAMMDCLADSEDSETIMHGFEAGAEGMDNLFPFPTDITGKAPEMVSPAYEWVKEIINSTSKTPMSNVRTRHVDLRDGKYRSFGYNRDKRSGEKRKAEEVKVLKRTTKPTTVYIKEELHRDDILDITDFDAVNYVEGMARMSLEHEVALAALLGDGRADGSDDKIDETSIRPIYSDHPVYTMRKPFMGADAIANLQGATNTAGAFGQNFIYAESMIEAATEARIYYRGTGNPVMFIAPTALAKMLSARDLNGRRIYQSKAELAIAFNVSKIVEVEEMDGLTRETVQNDVDYGYAKATGSERKCAAIIVSLSDYNIGAVKQGAITKFDDFDIDFNTYKYLYETRLSGCLIRPSSAIVLEEYAEGETLLDSDKEKEFVARSASVTTGAAPAAFMGGQPVAEIKGEAKADPKTNKNNSNNSSNK